MSGYRIVSKELRSLSPWTTLAAKSVLAPGDVSPAVYHSLVVPDYVNVLAVTAEGKVPLVRQYRPALERHSLELPGGLAEPDEAPVLTAARELHEETGYKLNAETVLLGCLDSDSGRLENRIWCYFAPGVTRWLQEDWRPEREVEIVMIDVKELFLAVEDGRFRHALHIAILGLAVIQGYLSPS